MIYRRRTGGCDPEVLAQMHRVLEGIRTSYGHQPGWGQPVEYPLVVDQSGDFSGLAAFWWACGLYEQHSAFKGVPEKGANVAHWPDIYMMRLLSAHAQVEIRSILLYGVSGALPWLLEPMDNTLLPSVTSRWFGAEVLNRTLVRWLSDLPSDRQEQKALCALLHERMQKGFFQDRDLEKKHRGARRVLVRWVQDGQRTIQDANLALARALDAQVCYLLPKTSKAWNWSSVIEAALNQGGHLDPQDPFCAERMRRLNDLAPEMWTRVRMKALDAISVSPSPTKMKHRMRA